METIAKPNKIEFIKGAAPAEATAVIEPFYPGYGMTIGNSLRRIMLSSLEGTAVIGVKIEGVSHEFSTIPHVKEDVLEIILNLKKLKLKMFTDEEIKLDLEVRGKKEVKASDITKDSRSEVVNKDLVIANITDNAGFLKMEITIGKGRGYLPVEAMEKKGRDVGFIAIDAVFSPVLSVGLKVENVRVGHMTNWDKLIMDIITDGTISPEEAYRESVKIFQEQVGALTMEEKAPEAAPIEEVKEEAAEEVEEDEAGDKEEKDEKKAKKEKKEKKEKKAKKTK